MTDSPRYVVKLDSSLASRFPDTRVWNVRDTEDDSIPAQIAGRPIYHGPNRDHAQADADWLNQLYATR